MALEYLKRLSLIVGACVIAIWCVELAVGAFYPISIMAVEAKAPPSADEAFVADDTLGLRPVFGGRFYDESGLLRIGSIQSRADAPKLLFIGDSVTADGRIMRALADRIGHDDVSYLNAGVPSYNIEQEVGYFLRHLKQLNPSEIVHQLHVNDLGTFAGVVRARGETVRIYSPRVKPADVDPVLYEYSQLYRLFLANFKARSSKDELKAGAFAALRTMQAYARDNGIPYHVYFFPSLEPLAGWSRDDLDTREYLVGVSRELGLRMVDQPVGDRRQIDHSQSQLA